MRGYLHFDEGGTVTPPSLPGTCPGILLFGYEWPPLDYDISAQARLDWTDTPDDE